MNAPHVAKTKGSLYGHIFRRFIHIAMLVIPIVYYRYGNDVASYFSISLTAFLLVLLGVGLCAELIRLSFGVVLFGQRSYESKQISAFAWGLLSIIVVLIFSPGPQFSIPIIWSLALADPLLGELRRIMRPVWVVELIGGILVLAIWWGCAYWFSISLWWGVVLAPITVAAEWLDLKWIDDNALMLLVPLIVVIIGIQF